MTRNKLFLSIQKQHKRNDGPEPLILAKILELMPNWACLANMDAHLSASDAAQLYLRFIFEVQFYFLTLQLQGADTDPARHVMQTYAYAFQEVVTKDFGITFPEGKIHSLLEHQEKMGILSKITLGDGTVVTRPIDPTYNLRIKLVRIPQGGAPIHVRISWVGIVLPARRAPEGSRRTEIGGSHADLKDASGGLIVHMKEALAGLAEHNLPSAQWFMRELGVLGALVFQADEAEILSHA